MVTKAIIEGVESAYSVKVRIPILDSGSDYTDSTSYNDLSEAIICTLPRTSYIPEKGDIVLVAFEDNDKGRPVIIGCLFKESGNLSQVNVEANNLIVNTSAIFKGDITLNNITNKELNYLEGLKGNIQLALNNIYDRLDNLEGNNNV